MDLGKRLKAKRKEKNISAEYLAKELGISFQPFTDMRIQAY